jgi:hypothetical protein
MVWFAVVLFIGIGVVFIRSREEMAQGMAMFTGAKALPGCAVAMGVAFFILAILALVLQQLGFVGTRL